MSIFGTILSKLGFGDKKQEETQIPATALAPVETAVPIATEADSAAVPNETQTPPSTVTSVSSVDIVTKLDTLADNHSESLNWKSSIVDLLKLLGLDSSLTHRKELATELGCPSEKMGDSASMNIWLHKTVLKKLAENGGNIPTTLLT